MGAGGATVVAERVQHVVRAALRSAPGRWWDAEELAAELERHAPNLSADPLAAVQRELRGVRQAGAAWLRWERQARPSMRARLMGSGKCGAPGFVYRWQEAGDA